VSLPRPSSPPSADLTADAFEKMLYAGCVVTAAALIAAAISCAINMRARARQRKSVEQSTSSAACRVSHGGCACGCEGGQKAGRKLAVDYDKHEGIEMQARQVQENEIRTSSLTETCHASAPQPAAAAHQSLLADDSEELAAHKRRALSIPGAIARANSTADPQRTRRARAPHSYMMHNKLIPRRALGKTKAKRFTRLQEEEEEEQDRETEKNAREQELDQREQERDQERTKKNGETVVKEAFNLSAHLGANLAHAVATALDTPLHVQGMRRSLDEQRGLSVEGKARDGEWL